MAASSPTVLDWDDVSVLVRLCMRPTELDSASASGALDKRHQLVNAVLAYLQVWKPGALIDNDVRRSLVSSLEEYSGFFAQLELADKGALSDEIRVKVEGIQKRLLLAIALSEANGTETLCQEIKDGVILIALLLTLYQPLAPLSS